MRVILETMAVLALFSCSRHEPNYAAAADKIGEMGRVPRAVKLIAAEILTRCDVPPDGRFIFYHWEASPGAPPGALYSLELTREQIANATQKQCLERQIKSLGMQSELDLGEEPPPPPSEHAK